MKGFIWTGVGCVPAYIAAMVVGFSATEYIVLVIGLMWFSMVESFYLQVVKPSHR